MNKIYKTNAFTRIKARAHNGKALYVISNDLKFSTVVTEMQEGDFVTAKSDQELLLKYNLEVQDGALLERRAECVPVTEVQFSQDFLSNLYLYDSILHLAVPIDLSVTT